MFADVLYWVNITHCTNKMLFFWLVCFVQMYFFKETITTHADLDYCQTELWYWIPLNLGLHSVVKFFSCSFPVFVLSIIHMCQLFPFTWPCKLWLLSVRDKSRSSVMFYMTINPHREGSWWVNESSKRMIKECSINARPQLIWFKVIIVLIIFKDQTW